MTSAYEQLESLLKNEPHTWLVTGCAGFIGSNLIERLLHLNQRVVGVDNFSTGFKHNLDYVKASVGEKWKSFKFIEGDLSDLSIAEQSLEDIEYVLHQAAMGSVPRSIENPIMTFNANIVSQVNLMTAAKDKKIKSFVYASSSSVYGDNQDLPKLEDCIGNALSPYAVSKRVCELYAENYHLVYGLKTIGIRYFNVFGKFQSPEGAYAAVIPRWIDKCMNGEQVQIFGDGETSRDFCYIKNVIQINLLAAMNENEKLWGKFLNCGRNEKTSLNELFQQIKEKLGSKATSVKIPAPEYCDFRKGDIAHSQADIARACKFLKYDPKYSVADGLSETVDWYLQKKDKDNN